MEFLKSDQAENDEPQPQVDVAFGFLIVKPPPVTVSTWRFSSRIDPLRLEVTAHAMEGDAESILAAGIDRYMTKPLRKAAILDVLTEFCKPVQMTMRSVDLNARRRSNSSRAPRSPRPYWSRS